MLAVQLNVTKNVQVYFRERYDRRADIDRRDIDRRAEKIIWAEFRLSFIVTIDEDPNLLKRTTTGDESWCFHFEPEQEPQSM